MKIITVSREFGSGGRELGRHLSDILGFDYYDREIITAIAREQGMNESYVERTLENASWKSIPLTYRRSFASAAVQQQPQTKLLLEQKRVIEKIAELDRDFVIVGRNADLILADYKPFNIFVCADADSKVLRCMERSSEERKPSRKEIEHNMRIIDKNRARTRELLSGSEWGNRVQYGLTVNTSGWQLSELSVYVAGFAKGWFGRSQ